MSTFEYKVKPGDTLQLGSTGTATKVGGVKVSRYEEVTTTGSSDVADPAIEYTMITSGGAHTVTLADGSFDGQVKKIIITAVASGTITITPANFANGTSMTMAEILDSVELIWDGSDWNIAQASGVAIV
jgi:hypothetical protein